jgi:hypothetical protein
MSEPQDKPSAGPGNLTNVVLGGTGVAAVLGIATYLAFAHNLDRRALLFALPVLLGALLLILLFWLVARWIAARKAAPFTQNLARSAAITPNAINAPAARAKLDNLRRSFDEGVDKFRAAGKDLYKLPWYVLVGESGSGKTEAIRHSNIPFPPGLQDPLQGAGGTVNMHWWFSNEAVIIDTAGRYLFDEVEPGTTAEWTEFLRLLVKNRPRCPINGLLLVIPAQSLILDTADKIESKASKIAQQLDRIQRALQVRFPVYVLVTKCDLINGFREFFDNLDDPRLQHQILGWSNPDPLDEPFNFDLVEGHLKTVHDKLSRRRLGLLLDPVARESMRSRRLNEVDALFSLPDSLLKLGPRLRQYLEMIFVAGEWSSKPLFLRGIYFTSSMREGQALDAELAELLGVPVESLPEGRAWDRNRAFFLRDLCVKKVFPEKGLVTTASNTTKAEWLRNVLLLGAGFASAILLGLFTWWGNSQLTRTIGDQQQIWEDVAHAVDTRDGGKAEDMRAVAWTPSGQVENRLSKQVKVANPKTRKLMEIGQLYRQLHDMPAVNEPPVFHGASLVLRIENKTANLNELRLTDTRAFYAQNIIAPLFDVAHHKLESLDRWDDPTVDSVGALRLVIRYESGKVSDLAPGDLSALWNFLLPEAVPPLKWESLVEQQSFSNSYRATPLTEHAVNNLIEFFNRRAAGSATTFASIQAHSKELIARQSAMHEFCQGLPATPIPDMSAYRAKRAQWDALWAAYAKSDATVNADLSALRLEAGKTLRAAYAEKTGIAYASGQKVYRTLLGEFPATPPEASSVWSRLNSQLTSKPATDAQLDQTLAQLDDDLLKQADGGEKRVVQRVYEAYSGANGELPPLGSAGTQPSSAEAIPPPVGKLIPLTAEVAAADRVLIAAFLIEPFQRHERVTGVLDKLPASREAMVQRIRSVSTQGQKDLLKIPFTTAGGEKADPDFDPAAVGVVFAEIRKALDSVKADLMPDAASSPGNSPKPPSVLAQDELRGRSVLVQHALSSFQTEYLDYWCKRFPQPLPDPVNAKWASLQQDLIPLGFDHVNERFELLGRTVSKAISAVVLQPPAADTAAGKVLKDCADLQEKLKSSAVEKTKIRFSNWASLPDDPTKAREKILLLHAEDFVDGFMVTVPPDTAADTFTQYWHNITYALLDALSHEPVPAAVRVVERLGGDVGARFPLRRAADADLSREEIDALVDDLKTVAVSPATREGSSGDSIAAGGKIRGDRRINDDFDHLARGGLNPDVCARLDVLRAFIQSLPGDSEPANCRIFLPAKDSQKLLQSRSEGRSSAFERWGGGVVLVFDDKGPGNPPAVAPHGNIYTRDATELGTVQWPGRAFHFGFMLNPDQTTPPEPYWIPGPVAPTQAQRRWQCLRLLGQFENSVTADNQGAPAPPGSPKGKSKNWYVELRPQAFKDTFSVWLLLKFDREIPDPSTWWWKQ